jgi:hypothetical protein
MTTTTTVAQSVEDLPIGRFPLPVMVPVRIPTRATAHDGAFLSDDQIDYLGELVDTIDSLNELVCRLQHVATAGHQHGGTALEAARELNRVDVRLLADIVTAAAVEL